MGRLKIGYFGGSFDPPHLGHLTLARKALEQMGLDQVLWVLTPLSPLKHKTFATLEQRIKMVELMVSVEDCFKLSRVDLDRTPPYYSVDTAKLIRQQYQKPVELYCVLGADSLKYLPKWYHHKEFVLDRVDGIIVADRPGVTIDMEDLNREVPGIENQLNKIDMPEIDISSEKIREAIGAGRDIASMVTTLVYELIKDEAIY
ncbi:MAG: nicotinate (nicotinamide) nucleotide adenylyltransferase [Anaerolineaceae bacterium]|nr:nicotinate (nicotinamide) nucleotide adenylyltransferase [Anaerolineaceae bacterium]